MNGTHIPFPHPRTVRFAERASGHDPIQRVLAVVDLGAVRRPALDKAARLASAFGATLELYACESAEAMPTSWAGGSTLAQYRSVIRERRLALMEELAAPYRHAGLNVTTTHEYRARPEEGLVIHAIRSGANLIVKDVSRHASGDADRALIAHLPMPLMLVRAAAWGEKPRIATSLDPCRSGERPVELDESVAALGASVSRALGGVSFAVHALEGPAHLPGDVVPESEKQAVFERQRARVLALVCHASLDDREVRFVERRVPEGIVQLVNETQPSILVMGVAARPRAAKYGGGTASDVLNQTACDLLVVKPTGFISPAMVTE